MKREDSKREEIENSTFHEAKEHFKLVKEKLTQKNKEELKEDRRDIQLTPIHASFNTSFSFCRSPYVPDNKSRAMDEDPYDVTSFLLTHILETVSSISHCPDLLKGPVSDFCMKMKNIQVKTERLLQAINTSLGILKDSNDVVYDVLHRMDSTCKEIVLGNSDLLEIIQRILLKFCEVGDLLDFNQTEETINCLFEMSKLIYIYKSRVSRIPDRVILDKALKKEKFPFYYEEENDKEDEDDSFQNMDSSFQNMDTISLINKDTISLINKESSLLDKDIIPYTDWSTWIGTFVEEREKKESYEGTPVKKKCLRQVQGIKSEGEGDDIKFLEDQLKIKTIPFEDLPKKVRKIGEASFSEVFKSKGDVYKIIPLGLGEGLTPYRVFLGEAYIQSLLSKESGICKLKGLWVAKGKYPQEYLDAWDSYGIEENERPCKYSQDQTYGVLVMEDGGVSLENYSFGLQKELIRFIKSLVKILSRLETLYEFEHRDLHWGNILINNSKINIIDFTLSRIRIPEGGMVVYNDLSKYPWLFQGDSSVDEQFEIYRKMRDSSGGHWEVFSPVSNFYWLEYLINKCYAKMKRIRLPEMKDRLLGILRDSSNIKEIEERLSTWKA